MVSGYWHWHLLPLLPHKKIVQCCLHWVVSTLNSEVLVSVLGILQKEWIDRSCWVCSSGYGFWKLCGSGSIEEFIPLLRERMNVLNPFVRQFLVGWITVLDSVPEIDMLGFLPDFLDGGYLWKPKSSLILCTVQLYCFVSGLLSIQWRI